MSEDRIPKFDIDFTQEGQEQFFLHLKEKNDDFHPGFIDPHSHNYYCLSFLYEGKTLHFADWRNVEMQGPALLILDKDQVHIHTDLKGCKVVSIAFAPDFIRGQNKRLEAYMETVFSCTQLVLSENELNELDRYIRLMVREYHKADGKDMEIISCLLNIVLIRCAHLVACTSKGISRKKDLFAEFKTMLGKYYRSNHQVRFYAARLHVTPDVLNETVKAACDKTPKQLIDERLLTEAKRLLYWSDITAREVSLELGFETDGYFNRFFKKYTGMTPGEYRKTAGS